MKDDNIYAVIDPSFVELRQGEHQEAGGTRKQAENLRHLKKKK